MIGGVVCPVAATFAAAGVAASAWAATKGESKPSAARFAGVSALVFAAQTVNFPVSGGTSGHLIGGVLASVLLGTPFGVLAMALVASVQCLVFRDGGLAVLGANILNMSVIGAGAGGWLANRFRSRGITRATGIGATAWASAMVGALACSAELSLAGSVSFSLCAPAMLGIHALAGIAEALFTVAAVALIPTETSSPRSAALAPALAATIIALALSPFASPLPDGLEWVAAKLGFLQKHAPAFVAPLDGYAMPGIASDFFAAALAGLAGVVAVMASAFLIACVLSRREAY